MEVFTYVCMYTNVSLCVHGCVCICVCVGVCVCGCVCCVGLCVLCESGCVSLYARTPAYVGCEPQHCW